VQLGMDDKIVIPYSRQHITKADIRAVARALEGERITQGKTLEEFERALAKKVGARYCVAFSSGTAALHGAYFAAGIGKGNEVIVPAITFAATANTALYLGAKPVFADVELATGLMSVKDAARKITRRTKAIVPVDYAGRPADLTACKALAKKHNIILIEDAAQSLGARYRGKPVGAQADMTMFSFHPVKSITTGEGGAVATNSKTFYERLRLFRTHGIIKESRLLAKKNAGGWHQEMHALGFNYRLTDIQAALGLSQLARLSKNVAKRRTLVRRYDALLSGVPGLILPQGDSRGNRSAWHLYTLRVSDARKRREVFDLLHAAGIGAQVHHIPVYLHPYYQRLGYKKGLCPNAEAFYARELSIPLHPTLTTKEQDSVVSALRKIMAS
jgi:UDP-4-amino-4,6-dideoxy-N-acetyl-beta-L-altrosamine transaminase